MFRSVTKDDSDTRYVDASALMLGTGGPQQFDPSSFSPESIRRMKHMENTIQDALANSPESMKREPSPTCNVLHVRKMKSVY